MRQGPPKRRSIRLKVEALAQQKGLSDRELAHLANVDVRVIRRMYAGQGVAGMTLSQLARVAEALEVPTCALIEDVTSEHKG